MNIDVKLETRLFDDDYGFSDLLEKYNGKLTDDAKKEIKELIEEDIMYMIEQCNWTFSEASERESTTEVSKKNESKALNIADVSDCSGVIRTERGWAGHFICADRCRFRRNTLLTYNDIKIVVSSVGLMKIDDKFYVIGAGRYFETMAFHADKNDKRYFDADISKQVYFDSDWAIAEVDADDKANKMHEVVVAEISTKLENGYKFEITE